MFGLLCVHTHSVGVGEPTEIRATYVPFPATSKRKGDSRKKNHDFETLGQDTWGIVTALSCFGCYL